MTTQRAVATQPGAGKRTAREPKLPDPPRKKDMQQRRSLSVMDGTLLPHFAHRGDVLVSGGGYLCFRTADHPSTRLEPDIVVAFGVNPGEIISDNGYIIDDVGKPPDFVLEVASRSTGRRDYTVKRERYARFGVGEYWRFDHTGGQYHDAPLAGDVLVGDQYVPITLAGDRPGKMLGMLSGYSEVLDLYLCWDHGNLRFYDPKTDEFLMDPEELESALAEAQVRIRQLEAELGQSERS